MWTYTLDNTDPAVQALTGAATLQDTFDAVTVDGTVQTVTITINAQNDNPVLDLDANNSATAGTGYATEYPPSGVAIAVTDTDTVITDLDHATLASATITITNRQANDLLSVNGALPGNIAASAYNPATGVLTLTSAGATATLAQWQTALHQVQFSNTSSSPNTTDRTVTVVVNDGIANSNVTTTTISLNRPPVADDDAASVIAFDKVAGNVIAGASGDGQDTDPNGDTLTVIAITGGTGGHGRHGARRQRGHAHPQCERQLQLCRRPYRGAGGRRQCHRCLHLHDIRRSRRDRHRDADVRRRRPSSGADTDDIIIGTPQ